MMSFRPQCWLAVALLLAPPSLAFMPTHLTARSPSTTSRMVAIDPRSISFDDEEGDVPENNVDMSKVLLEVESALQLAAQDSIVDPVQGDKLDASSMLQDENGAIDSSVVAAMGKDQQMVATMLAGSAIGVVAGSPLVFGAALGVAGSKLLDDSEEGLKNRKKLEQLCRQIADQMHGAVAIAQTDLLEEGEEVDASKVSKKLMALVQSRANEIQTQVQSKANTWQADAKRVPSMLASVVKEKLESEEFQREMKQAPSRAFNALKGFVESEEVKAASGSLWKAVKATMESDEMKALQSRASQAVKESLENKKKSN